MNETLSGIPALLDPFRKSVSASGASDSDFNDSALCKRVHYIVAESALYKAMQVLITSGFDLPIDADEQVRRQHFSEPVRMTAGDVAAQALSCE